MTLAADECGRVQTDDSPFDGFLPPGTRFILARALRHDGHGYPAAQTTIRGNERSEIIPAVDRHHIRIRLLQSRPERTPKPGAARKVICCFREERNFVIPRRRSRGAPRVIAFG